MMNIIDFLFGNEIRIEPHEGFKKCILNYRDGIFTVSRDKENENTIATFYVRDEKYALFRRNCTHHLWMIR